MRRPTRAAAAAAALLLAGAARPAGAQDAARLRVLAIAEMTSVRFEVSAPDGAALAGAPVRATIAGVADGRVLWAGEIGRLVADGAGEARLVGRVDGISPELWSPRTPNLYRATVEAVGSAGTVADTVRFGFRSVQVENGRILLNGRPIFLRGSAINPPDRGLPDSLDEDPRFARDYIRYLESIGVNIIRLSRLSQAWLDVADEEGMMIFQGNYGSPPGGTKSTPPALPLERSVARYREEVLAPLASHPSVVIYVLGNELAAPEVPYLSEGAAEMDRWLSRLHGELEAWDDTRPYIANAGFGRGRAGDVCDIHHYWGWYYNSVLSFETLRDRATCADSSQPITLSETVGSYTGPDGRFNLVSNSKQPAAQLNWTGHAPDAEQAERALAYQSFVVRQGVEITRRIRSRNASVAGIMPFTILFRRWSDIARFADMEPKPAAAQLAVSYQPVLLSWELWTPQVYSGTRLRPIAHVVNDSETGEELAGLELRYEIVGGDGTVHARGRTAIGRVPYYAAVATPLAIPIPPALPTGEYVLRGRLLRGADTLSRNEAKVWIAAPDFAGRIGEAGRRVRLHDPAGETTRALRRLGIPFEPASGVARLDPARDLLVVGAGAWDATLSAAAPQLRSFVSRGGRVLVLAQDSATFDTDWLPARVRLLSQPLDHSLHRPPGRPYREGMAVNPEWPDHPVFDGIDRDRLFWWSDAAGWNETRPGFPAIYPVTHGFVLGDPAERARTAILANYGNALEGVGLAELFGGEGSVLLSGFGLMERTGVDPVADRLLVNLVRYQGSAAAHFTRPLVTAPIVWGEYGSERGLVTGILDGLLLNTIPLVPPALRGSHPTRIDEKGFHYAGKGGGWNSQPSIQYVARGRRPFGVHAMSLGGSPRLPRDAAPEGEGTFHLRVPDDRRTMVTRVWNPSGQPLELEVEVDGASRREIVPPNDSIAIRSSLPARHGVLAITYRGDRRLVLLETDFRPSSGQHPEETTR